jgi:DNA primase
MLSPSDEIKARLDIVEIIRQYVPLKPAGLSFVARCPFHNEKSASFNVSPTKQVWHCFGCGRGGDLFSFIMEIEKLTFIEALRLLAPRAGVVLSQEQGPNASLRNKVLDILDQTAEFYHFVLLGPAGAAARDYLTKRGVSEEIIKEWRLGYAPDSWDDLILFLKDKGFKDKEISAAGLSIEREAGRNYNRFRGRIMFPIREVNGNTIGFTGRLLPELEKKYEGQGKYVNSPQSIVYDKSRVLFGLDKAKQAMRENDFAIVVEGQMDCLTAHQFGFNNVVASSGTALTEEQARLLKRFVSRVAFAFDTDSAGRKALDRGSDQAFHSELEALIVIVPEGKDPDECIRRDLEGWKEALKQARPVMEYYLEEACKIHDTETAAGRKAIVREILPRIARLANSVERDFWFKKLSQAADVNEVVLREFQSSIKSPAETAPAVEALPEKEEKKREELLSEQLVALLLLFPDLIPTVSPYVPAEQVIGLSNQTLYRQLVVYYNKNVTRTDEEDIFSYGNFRAWLQNQGLSAGDIQALDRLAILVEKEFVDINPEAASASVKNIQNELRRSYLSRRIKAVAKLIGELESQTPDAERNQRLDVLLKEFNDLAEEMRSMTTSAE